MKCQTVIRLKYFYCISKVEKHTAVYFCQKMSLCAYKAELMQKKISAIYKERWETVQCVYHHNSLQTALHILE